MFYNSSTEIARRAFLGTSALSLGSIALTSMLSRRALAGGGDAPPSFKLPKATAKRVIMLFLAGGMSQIDLFDEKPLLSKRRGEELPDSVRRGQRITGVTEKQGALPVVGSCFKYKKYGKAGLNMSELFNNMGEFADDFCLVRSLQTDHVLHEAAMSILFTGSLQLGRPSWGSWTSYALGTENKDLPEFVVMISGTRDGGSPPHPRMWHNGFLPGRYQGVQFRGGKEPVFFVSNPDGIDEKARKNIVDSVKALNEIEAKGSGDPDITTRIQAYELAAKMQTSVPDLTDLSKEPADILEQYGADPAKDSFANNCLLARRLAEKGVRFIQVCDGGWDHHYNIPTILKKKMEDTDKPVAALLRDLKDRSLLDDTIVIMVGEFGRTSYCEGPLAFNSYGRDHNQLCSSVLLAGGGFKGGFEYGKTDDWGWDVVENPVHMHDLHATILSCLGLEHTRLVTRFQGRDFRLTDVFGKVVNDLVV
ncbi:MAG: DUF1501 domain-containing protein [Planctomycetes bacterium]|nr:DUF1501 domain-containing protein [Planctomycetota bacterium]